MMPVSIPGSPRRRYGKNAGEKGATPDDVDSIAGPDCNREKVLHIIA